MRIRGLREARAAWRFCESRFHRGGLVLLYHRLAEDDDGSPDPFALAVSRRRFEEHLDVLRRVFEPVPLAELGRAVSRRQVPERAVAVTFDDGYASNLELGKPLLERYEVPATVFVVSGALDQPFFWWEELGRIVAASGRPRRELHRRLRRLGAGERTAALAELAAEVGAGAPEGRPELRPMTSGELRRLASGGLVETGAHTVSHPPLAELPEAEQRRELEGSKARLEEVLGRPVTSFSYPYGEAHDYTRRTAGLAAEVGFELACTNVVGLVHARSDVYQLPRYWVRDWSGDELERRLRRWMRPGQPPGRLRLPPRPVRDGRV